MVLAATAVVLATFALVSRGYSRAYRYAGAIALVGHLVFAIAVLPRLPYSWDIDVFHEIAVGLLSGAEAAPLSSLDAFGTLQALLYAVFGVDPTVLAIFNGLFAVLMPLPACYVASRLYDSLESTTGLMLAVLFLPLPFVFHGLPMRDSLSTLLALTLLATVVRVVAERRYWWALSIPPLWGMLALLREELALVILLGALGAIVVRLLVDGLDREVSWVTLAPAAIPLAVAGFAMFAVLFPVDALNARVQYRAIGGAAYLESMTYGSWLDVILAAPVRAIYFQFAPFPLHVTSAFDLVTVLSLPVLIVLVTAAAVSLRHAGTDFTVQFTLLVVYVAGVVGYGLIDANFGTTIRHRAVFVFLLGIFAAPVLASWYGSLRRRVDDAIGQRRHDDEGQQKTEELDPRAEVRGEH